ncbi:hypothetical protein M529_18495 [Sphingobium ummariense RL-3]|uniref:NmrA-like domain-containing protein n=1 Tax=Sphingobium ummariense RL-3 TaxID=1346791 RepID=T0K2G3_9SPHN|nr:hypothetical protein M529_18495 [Sphingobium ummariense RL-3]
MVTAAGGNQSRRLIPKLSAMGHQVRAVRVSGDKEAETRALGASEVLIGDLTDVDFYTRALEGCDAVYHIGPAGRWTELEMGHSMIEAARRCRTPHVVFSSVLHSIIDIVQHRFKRDIEEKLYESGLPYTVLKPCDFMIPAMQFGPVLATGELRVFWKVREGRRGSLIDVEDLTDVAAKVLVEGSRHFYASYELSGTDKLTSREMARIFSRVMGKEIPVVQSNVDEAIAHRWGSSEITPQNQGIHRVLTSIAAWYSDHEFVGNSNILEWFLGRKPITFEQYLRRELPLLGVPVT